MASPETFSLGQEAPPGPVDNAATLYFHYPCFDGIISCILAWDFLEKTRRWNFVRFGPIGYHIRPTWVLEELKKPCAIVDFLYHSDATFWADHHPTAFVTPQLQAEFEAQKRSECMVYDKSARSCASLLSTIWKGLPQEKKRFAEMVLWADKIDSAAYASVDEAIFGKAPALQIHLSLMSKNDNEYCRLLLRELRTKDLSHVASLPEVRARYLEVQNRTIAGLEHLRQHIQLLSDGIVFFDVKSSDTEIINRYAPYHFFKNARYSIAVLRSDNEVKITAMRNPWREFESVPLGKIFEDFGGGGHRRVGSVLIPSNAIERQQAVIQSLLLNMRTQRADGGGTDD